MTESQLTFKEANFADVLTGLEQFGSRAKDFPEGLEGLIFYALKSE